MYRFQEDIQLISEAEKPHLARQDDHLKVVLLRSLVIVTL